MPKINSKTVTRPELVRRIAAGAGVSTRAAGDVLSALVGEVLSSVDNGERVLITGLGAFDAHVRPACKRRNPRTGEFFVASATRTVRFRPVQAVRKTVKED